MTNKFTFVAWTIRIACGVYMTYLAAKMGNIPLTLFSIAYTLFPVKVMVDEINRKTGE